MSGGSLEDIIVFGAVLFLAPLILIFAMFTVLRGTKGALRRPVVPDDIRREVH